MTEFEVLEFWVRSSGTKNGIGCRRNDDDLCVRLAAWHSDHAAATTAAAAATTATPAAAAAATESQHGDDAEPDGKGADGHAVAAHQFRGFGRLTQHRTVAALQTVHGGLLSKSPPPGAGRRPILLLCQVSQRPRFLLILFLLHLFLLCVFHVSGDEFSANFSRKCSSW